ncbi:MAG: hypothetical protein GFH27_549323n145 [Chloroflexi bacterium AL-W]|nr:hypothetical protein [Chloroflexi bacterium AL-N1]NOK70296.1 hypothetical protein [Chloroflexi bacterium AL-N10]NOK77833.1 hypothetical protein [Chloroflexi bacterium AL-N5]NOK84842.1 hypothetical protein [Chloroflexi bacterium AL-W]NOK92449.1 hypothetical protein [Chloroflexi bacterium AL-N15]
MLDYVHDQGGETGVTYRIAYRSSVGEMIHFALGPVNSARPEASESIQVLNQDGTLSTTSGWPTFDMIWTEDQRVYSIQANGADVTREEILQIAEGLQIVE